MRRLRSWAGVVGACGLLGGCPLSFEAEITDGVDAGDAGVAGAEDAVGSDVPEGSDYVLSVDIEGMGRILSIPDGIDCSSACAHTFAQGEVVTLRASPGPGWGFAGWSGACSGIGDCRVEMTSRQEVSARFARDRSMLTVRVVGQGVVSSVPVGIDCGGDCSESYQRGSTVTLQALPRAGSEFVGWAGGCSGTAACSMTIDDPLEVTATFELRRFPLSVQTSGRGRVTSAPNGVDCGSDCREEFSFGTEVTLTALPEGTATFTGWSGACSGLGPCRVVLTEAKSVGASFGDGAVWLTVQHAGNGSGVVSSTPAGIDCGADCLESYASGTAVRLTATPATASRFTGWSGACAGTNVCALTVAADASVTANFSLERHTLNVALAGAGRVASVPAGIDCGNDCDETFDHGAVVVLQAQAEAGATFDGWSGACSGTGSCQVTMTGGQRVTASFSVARHPLTVRKAGSGTGVVTSLPTGIDCGADCTDAFDFGTNVTLVAVADRGSIFRGWSQACTVSWSAGACSIAIDRAHEVTATFDVEAFPLAVSLLGDGQGEVESAPGGIRCPSDCGENFRSTTVVSLTARAGAGSNFIGWTGACSGAGVCQIDMDAAKTVNARFTLETRRLEVRADGSGTGRVTSAPAGIDCGADCEETFALGSALTLTANPSVGSRLSAWTGACSGNAPTCGLVMDDHRQAIATFEPATFVLRVSMQGMGRVVSSPPGIDCGFDCEATFPSQTVVRLTAAPFMGYGFAGWSGVCAGGGVCSATMGSDQNVSADFDSGLLAWYPFDSGARDASENGHTGTSSGATTTADRRGRAGRAYAFDGDDFVEVPDAFELSGMLGLSMCAWVRPSSATRNGSLIVSKALHDGQDGNDSYALSVTPQPKAWLWTVLSNAVVDQQASLGVNVWTHVCTTWNGLNVVLYVNAAEVDRRRLVGGTIQFTQEPLRLGRCRGHQTICRRGFDGVLDEIKIWNRGLSASEIGAEASR